MRAMALAGLVMALDCAGAWAGERTGHHGEGHDEMHTWYKTLKHYECCDGKDCRPTRARLSDRGIEVQVDGEWTRVPPDSIVRATPPDGRAHVCAQKGPWSPKVIFCVVLAPGV